MLGFLGPNGSGKTTAMRTVFGLVRPDRGSVTWDGEPIELEGILRFGYMPEQRGLYPKMRAHDQLTYLGTLHGLSRAEAGERADTWLERFGLTERRKDPVEALSHGNQQRVQLAAAMLHEPDLLMLDEPFSGLDPVAVDTMSEVLREQAERGTAVVFSSHQLDLVEDLCEEVSIINYGSVIVEGNVKRLKDSAPLRRLEVEVEGDITPLLGLLSDVRSVTSNGEHHSIAIGTGTEIDEFIARAQSMGPLRHFSYTAPSLSQLFREAVR